MKVALGFIINYEHTLTKEHIWREWIEPNKDIINVYFFYDDYSKIQTDWVKQHALPLKYCKHPETKTSYYYIIPAYISLMRHGLQADSNNQWFIFLTESCCPIISPKRFRYLFFEHYQQSIFSWKRSWWNIEMHKRANLRLLPKQYHLANDPWFVMNRLNVMQCLDFLVGYRKLATTVCEGGLANESLFAIILYQYRQLGSSNGNSIINKPTHLVDWQRMSSSTSPHIFIECNKTDLQFIKQNLGEGSYMFIRKISPDFPDEQLRYFIYEYQKAADDLLIIDNGWRVKWNLFLWYFGNAWNDKHNKYNYIFTTLAAYIGLIGMLGMVYIFYSQFRIFV